MKHWLITLEDKLGAENSATIANIVALTSTAALVYLGNLPVLTLA